MTPFLWMRKVRTSPTWMKHTGGRQLASAVSETMVEGAAGQHLAIEVRDELRPVLELNAFVGSKILRKQ